MSTSRGIGRELSEIMTYDAGYTYPNHSELHRAIEAHYRARGVTSERKLFALVLRWKATKGLKFPHKSI